MLMTNKSYHKGAKTQPCSPDEMEKGWEMSEPVAERERVYTTKEEGYTTGGVDDR
jgi:hypothetical protein